MKRYQLLIKKEADDKGLRPFAREIGVQAQSISNYLIDGTEPRAANLEKMAHYFGESVASLLMEVGAQASIDNEILDELKRMPGRKKKELLEYMKGIK